jgi:hypothetical protein
MDVPFQNRLVGAQNDGGGEFMTGVGCACVLMKAQHGRAFVLIVVSGGCVHFDVPLILMGLGVDFWKLVPDPININGRAC